MKLPSVDKEADLRNLLFSLEIPPDTADELVVDLLHKGIILTLKQDGSPEAVHILKEAQTRSPIHSIQVIALDALKELAHSENENAANALLELAIYDDHEKAMQILRTEEIALTNRDLLSAYYLLNQQIDDLKNLDPEYGLISVFYLNCGSPDLRSRLKAAGMKADLGSWVSIVTCFQEITIESMVTLVNLFENFNEVEKNLSRSFLDQKAGNKYAQEALCNLFIVYEDEKSKQIAQNKNYTPEDTTQKALFFFLSEEWDKYESIDLNYRLLSSAYELADTKTRKRILEHSRYTGYTDWLQEHTSKKSRLRLINDMEDADWKITLTHLSKERRFTDLWKLSNSAPPVWVVHIFKLLNTTGWQPELSENGEKEKYIQLVSLAKSCSDTTDSAPSFTQTKSPSEINCTAYDSSNQNFATGSSNNAIHLWQIPRAATIYKTITGPTMQPRSMAFSPDGSYLACASHDNRILLFRTSDGKTIKSILAHDGLIRSLVIHPSGNALYSASFDGSIKSWRLPDCSLVNVIQENNEEIFDLAISSDGNLLLSCGTRPEINVWELPGGKIVRKLTGHTSRVTNITAGMIGSIAASYARDGQINLWNYTSNKLLGSIHTGEQIITALNIHPSEQFLMGSCYDGDINIWNISTGKITQHWSQHKHPINSMVTTPDGDHLITTTPAGNIYIWHLKLHMIARTPLANMEPGTLSYLQEMEEKNLSIAENNWRKFIVELLKYRQRYDIELADSYQVNVGEFDIEL